MSRSPKGIAAIRPTVAGERLTRRQRDAVLAIARSKRHALSEAQIRREIGSYATNALAALEDRGLIAYQLPIDLEAADLGAWILTDRGHQLVQDLANNRILE